MDCTAQHLRQILVDQSSLGVIVITLFRGVGGEGEVAGRDEAAPPGAHRHPCVVHHHQRQLERGHPHRVHIAVVLPVPSLQQIILNQAIDQQTKKT